MEQKKRIPLWKMIAAIVLRLVILVVLIAAAGVAFLSIVEYYPKEEEVLAVEGEAGKTVSPGDTLKIMTWNLGFGALGDNADFFMDGGTMVNPSDKDRVNFNMEGFLSEAGELAPDVILLQEIDEDSYRSHHINQTDLFREAFPEMVSSFAYNLKVLFIPYPIPPMGKVSSGIMTLSSYPVAEAKRVPLPCPFTWPTRVVNLKRCLLINRIPVEGTNKELVIVNLHLEAYDEGEGKIAQTKMLAEILRKEAEKGNYVIAGGDFNQVFPGDGAEKYPAQEGKWQAGVLDTSSFQGDWKFLTDSSLPTCRSLDQVYAGAEKDGFQYYLIDGFIVSDNVEVNSCVTEDTDFVFSDHNPVVLEVTLNK